MRNLLDPQRFRDAVDAVSGETEDRINSLIDKGLDQNIAGGWTGHRSAPKKGPRR